MHIISSLSIFGNALQQIRDTTQKEKILNHLLRNITTTASSLIPPSIASTIASSVNAFSTLPPPDAYFKPMHFKPIPVTMPPPTNRIPAAIPELDSQPTMAIPQRPVYPPIPDIITQRPPSTPSNVNIQYGQGSVKQLPFLPTIPAEDRPMRVQNISPLQDANRFAYKTNTPSAVSHSYNNQLFTVTPGKPLSYNLGGSTTENSFHIFDNHLNSEFHNLKHQFQSNNHNKPPKKQNLRIIGETLTTPKAVEYNPNHSFFTIDDAVTAGPHYYQKTRGKPQKQHRFKPDFVSPTQTADVFSTISNLEHFRTVTTTTVQPEPPVITTTTPPSPPSTIQEIPEEIEYSTPEPVNIPKPRNKLRRKKPRPQFVNLEQEMDTATSNVVTNSWEYTRNRHRVRGRPSADIFGEAPTESNIVESSVTEQPIIRNSDRVKFPSRNRFTESASTTAEPRTRGTTPPAEKENQVEEIGTTKISLFNVHTTTQQTQHEDSTTEEHLRHRTRFRYKPRTRPTTTTTTTEITPQSEEINVEEATENPLMDEEEKMILSLMNNFGGSPSTEEVFTTSGPSQSRIKPIIKFDTKNRPRFSVKDYRNRQNSTTKSNEVTATTPSNNLRNRSKLTKEELENRATKRFSTSTPKPRSALPRRKPLGTRLDINKPRTSTEASTTTENTSVSQAAQTTPMTIKLKKSFRNRDKSRYGTNNSNEKVTLYENDIPQTEEDELVRSESNHYGQEAQPEETKIVERVTEKSHETSIMKIAKDDHSYRSHIHRASTTPSALAELMNTIDNESNLLQRVSDLTVTSGQNFANSVNTKHVSRKIPNYFTIATEDPILPIEAFFPNVINKE